MRHALTAFRFTTPKNESGKEKVKFLYLYQALTEVAPFAGKVFGRGVVKHLTFSHSRQLLARAARTFRFSPLSIVRGPVISISGLIPRFFSFLGVLGALVVVFRSPFLSLLISDLRPLTSDFPLLQVSGPQVSSLQILLLRSGLVRFGPVWSGRRLEPAPRRSLLIAFCLPTLRHKPKLDSRGVYRARKDHAPLEVDF